MIPFKHIIKELFAEKTRIILTILAIVWGTFAIASMLAIGEGLRVNFGRAMENIGHNLLTIQPGTTSRSANGIAANTAINLTSQDLQSIKNNVDGILAISSEYDFSGSIEQNEQLIKIPIAAVDPHYAGIHQITVLPPGRFINTLDIQQKALVIVLGSKTAEKLFPFQVNPVGNTIAINGKDFTIIGVMQEKNELSMKRFPDAMYNWIPSSTYQMLANPQFIDKIALTYNDPNQLLSLEARIIQIIAVNHQANPTDENIVDFQDASKSQQRVDSFFLGMQIFLGFVGSLTLIVAGAGVANVMYASVSKATRDIGVRMAIGARPYQILLHYVFEALLATAIGGIIGILLTELLVYLIHLIPMHAKIFDQIGRPYPILSFSVIFIVILVLGTVGFLSGLFPAKKAAEIDPVEALRHD